MGHLPSKDLVDEPYIVDLETTRGRVDTVACVAITSGNIPNPDHPLFSKFQEIRCDAPVLYWYCAPPKTQETAQGLPPPPDASTLFKKLCLDAQCVVDGNSNSAADQKNGFVPLPILLVRLDHQSSRKSHRAKGTRHGSSQSQGGYSSSSSEDGGRLQNKLLPRLPKKGSQYNWDDATVIGYFGCRSFGVNGTLDDTSILGIFLNKEFYNDAKSLAMFSVAAACYKHFSLKAGFSPNNIPWPRRIDFETHEFNLPCLRLCQKLYLLYVQPKLREELKKKIEDTTLEQAIKDEEARKARGEELHDDFSEEMDFLYNDHKLLFRSADPMLIAQVCDALASEVNPHPDLRLNDASTTLPIKRLAHDNFGQYVMKMGARAVVPKGSKVGTGVVDDLTERAFANWRSANEPVVKCQLKKRHEAKNSTSTETLPFPERPNPTPPQHSPNNSTPGTPLGISIPTSSGGHHPVEFSSSTTSLDRRPESSGFATNSQRGGMFEEPQTSFMALPQVQQNQQTLGGMGNTSSSSSSNQAPLVVNLNNQPPPPPPPVAPVTRYYLSDRTPIYICNYQHQWIPVFWMNSQSGAPTSVSRSKFQLQQASAQHVCYDLPKPVLVMDLQGQQFMTDSNQPYIYIERGINFHTYENGRYIPSSVN